MKRYATVVVGGTFDTIHAGHEAILSKAFETGQRVIIGLTSDTYVRQFKNYKLKIKNFKKRQLQLVRWFKKQNWNERYTIVPIDDPYGPAIDSFLDAIVVSEETAFREKEINAMRKVKGLNALDVVVVPMVKGEDGAVLSSSRIRNGNLLMPESLRETLHKPLGPIVTDIKKDGHIIAVGDVATKTFLDKGVVPNLAIIDRKVERRPYDDCYQLLKDSDMVTVKSGPGFISKEAIDAIVHARHKVIVVEGEEDLLVLPAILHAIAGSIVYYGQPQKGIVEVRVTGLIKEKVSRLLAKFM